MRKGYSMAVKGNAAGHGRCYAPALEQSPENKVPHHYSTLTIYPSIHQVGRITGRRLFVACLSVVFHNRSHRPGCFFKVLSDSSQAQMLHTLYFILTSVTFDDIYTQRLSLTFCLVAWTNPCSRPIWRL